MSNEVRTEAGEGEVLTKREIRLLAEVAEIKRIYASISSRLTRFNSTSVVFTSAGRSEGKSSLAALVATTAASYTRRKVLLIDANWHRPVLHRFLELDPIQVPTDQVTLEEQIRASGFQRLDVLAAPPPEEAVKISSGESMGFLLSTLERARTSYDLVCLDTTGMFPTNRSMVDPVVLSAAADGVVLIVLAGITPRQEVKRALVSLETAGANALGVVVNQWQNRMRSY